jgi:predicted DNA-binding protein
MTIANKQDSPYQLRIPAELKLVIQAAASKEGLSTNAWLVRNIARSIWPEDPCKYIIPLGAITIRAERMLPYNPRTDTGIALRMPPELRRQITQISKSNHRTLSKELLFRLVALIAEDDPRAEALTTISPRLANHALLKSWTRLDRAIKELQVASVATLGMAVKRLEAERRAFDEVVHLFDQGAEEG